MCEVQLMLNSIKKVNDFINIIKEYDGGFYIISGSYLLDAASVMDLFSLNLNEPILLAFQIPEKGMRFFKGWNPFSVLPLSKSFFILQRSLP